MKREPTEPHGFIKPNGAGIPRLQAGEEVKERDYRLGCEAADAIEAACGADSVKWKRALAVGLGALTVAVAVATIRQMLADGGVLSAIPLLVLLIAVTAAAAWFSWRARRG